MAEGAAEGWSQAEGLKGARPSRGLQLPPCPAPALSGARGSWCACRWRGVPGGVAVLLLGRDRIPGGSGPARARYGKGRAATAARGWGSQGRGDTGLSLAAGAVRLARRRAASGRRLPTVGGRCGTGLRAKAGFLLVVTAVCQGGGAHRLAAVFWAGLRPRMR